MTRLTLSNLEAAVSDMQRASLGEMYCFLFLISLSAVYAQKSEVIMFNLDVLGNEIADHRRSFIQLELACTDRVKCVFWLMTLFKC